MLLPLGNALSWDGNFNEHVEDSTFSSVIDLVFNCTCFVYIGAWLPFTSYSDAALGLDVWRLVVLFLGILALRRIPSVLMLYKWIDEIEGWKQALFTGHFGVYLSLIQQYEISLISLDRSYGCRSNFCVHASRHSPSRTKLSSTNSNGNHRVGLATYRQFRRIGVYHHTQVHDPL